MVTLVLLLLIHKQMKTSKNKYTDKIMLHHLRYKRIGTWTYYICLFCPKATQMSQSVKQRPDLVLKEKGEEKEKDSLFRTKRLRQGKSSQITCTWEQASGKSPQLSNVISL